MGFTERSLDWESLPRGSQTETGLEKRGREGTAAEQNRQRVCPLDPQQTHWDNAQHFHLMFK